MTNLFPISTNKKFEGASAKDFQKEKNKKNEIKKIYNLGYLGQSLKITYLKNKKEFYFLKPLDKDFLLKTINLKTTLENIYKCNNEYSIELITHLEDEKNIYFIFNFLEKYSTLLDFVKNKNFNEETLLIIYKQILLSINNLHKNKIYGCNLHLSSFIFDEINKKIKFTDNGFSKMLKKNKKNSYKYKNIEFTEYTPSEYLISMKNNNENNNIINEKYDMWQIGILFYKIATKNEISPYPQCKNVEEFYNKVLKSNINLNYLKNYSSDILQIISKLLNKNPNERYSIDHLLKLEPFDLKSLKIEDNLNSNNNSINSNLISNSSKHLSTESFNISNNNINEFDLSLTSSFKKLNSENSIFPNINYISPLKNMDKRVYNSSYNKLDKNKILDISNKLIEIDKENKKISDAFTVIKYINKNVKDIINDCYFNYEDDSNFFINKLNELGINEKSNFLYEDINNNNKTKEEKYELLINNLIYENKKLHIQIEEENKNNKNLNKKIEDLEKEKDTNNKKYNEKINLLENKIDLLENIIFPNSNLNNNNDIINNKLLLQTLNVSIKNFEETNLKILNISDNIKNDINNELEKFLNEKENYINILIKSKEKFKNKILDYLNKENENKNNNNIDKNNNNNKDNNDLLNKKIEDLNKTIDLLKNEIKEQSNIILNNEKIMKEMNLKIQEDKKIINELEEKNLKLIDDKKDNIINKKE